MTADAIRALRQSLDLTQEEFGRLIDRTTSTVNRLEQGHSQPSRKTRKALEALAAEQGAA